MPKVCCNKSGKKTCREFSYTPAGKAAAKRAAKACRESGGKVRTQHGKHKDSPPKPPTAVTTPTGVQY